MARKGRSYILALSLAVEESLADKIEHDGGSSKKKWGMWWTFGGILQRPSEPCRIADDYYHLRFSRQLDRIGW